ncbi:biotin carboxyl carrier domain-containing protein [Pseudomonas sp. LB-090624]|uniref:acetyl-CoA carboxylase n=1 Tax=Pseudomonas sp. LB-090624 TaxID=2213079 RepID=UPI000D98A4D5|nr:acetyl-CoA carboxylase [Pseudomonas sp. LB-090624]PYB78886.1 biotin carboxyl carrier domain-containing protein [Pseudomonas sp. LB-090624]
MDKHLVERLVSLIENSALSEIEYSAGGTRIRLVRESGQTVPMQPRPPEAQSSMATTTRQSSWTIDAGLPGIFYRAPSPDESAFVDVGTAIEEGQQVGIIEAMKMLNVLESDRSGRVVRILVEDGASVEAGTPLFEVQSMEDTHV